MARRINRRARKLAHKRKMEQHYANIYHYGSTSPACVRRLREQLIREAEEDDSYWRKKHPPRNRGWEYWKVYYLTGSRQYAKKYSDKRIRQKYRQMIAHMDPEDVTAPRGADYEKEYDYAYTIW